MVEQMPKGKIKSNDKEWRAMRRRLTAGMKQTQVGWFGVMYPEENGFLPVAQVAKWNEEGHYNGGLFEGTRTPPRPFLRTTFLYGMELFFNDHVNKLASSVAEGRMSWQQVAEYVGDNAKDILQDVIDVKSKPPNSPMTILMKGFNNPLIESGYMKDTVTWQVKGRRKKKVTE